MKIFQLFLLSLIALGFASCDDDDDVINFLSGNEPVDVTGITYIERENEDFSSVYGDIRSAIAAAGPEVSILAEANHRSATSTIGLELRPTRTIMFGNPRLGTPLMMENMLIGLDLPQKIVVYQAEDDDIIAAYNSTDYLSSRYNVTGPNADFATIGTALENFVQAGTDEETENSADVEVDQNVGIVTMTTNDSVDVVYDRLVEALSSTSGVRVVAELDHSENARSVGMTLPASRIVFFGNPNFGGPLLQDEQAAGLDIPLSILVFDNGTNTTIAYNDPQWLADRFDIDDELPVIGQLEDLYERVTGVAMGN